MREKRADFRDAAVRRALRLHLEGVRTWGLKWLPVAGGGATIRSLERPMRTGSARSLPPTDPRGSGGEVRRVESPTRGAAAAEPEEARELRALAEEVAACCSCGLCETRTQTVFGVGSPTARLMFVGEAPGEVEDRRGEPFVGPAGQLLDRIIAALGLARADVYIANVLKCRPPRNRDPMPDEVARCRGFLERQLDVVRPEMVVALGRPAANLLLDRDTALGRLRGRVHMVRGIPVVATYHPAYLLRNPRDKAKTWQDLQFVIRELDLEPPTPHRG